MSKSAYLVKKGYDLIKGIDWLILRIGETSKWPESSRKHDIIDADRKDMQRLKRELKSIVKQIDTQGSAQ